MVIIAKLNIMKKSIRKKNWSELFNNFILTSVFAVTSHDLGLTRKYQNACKNALSNQHNLSQYYLLYCM